MKKIIGIYSITNLKNNKKYIGQSINVYERWIHHKITLKGNYHSNRYLQRAYNNSSENNFEFQLLKVCKPKYLDRFEKLYIRIYNTNNRKYGYNLDSGGNEFKKHSIETKKKISKTVRKNHPLRGKHLSKETRRKMSESHKGHIKSKKHCNNLSKSLKKYYSNIDNRKFGADSHSSIYTLWDTGNVHYSKTSMFEDGRTPNPCKCFSLKFNAKYVPIGGFIDFYTPELLNQIIRNEIYGSEKEKK